MEGTMVTVNHEIDFEKAQEIALGYDIIAEPEEKVEMCIRDRIKGYLWLWCLNILMSADIKKTDTL